jgi:hypothetical protein
MGGDWSNSTTAMNGRPDGFNVVWSFNGSADPDPGEALWSHAIDQLKKRASAAALIAARGW